MSENTKRNKLHIFFRILLLATILGLLVALLSARTVRKDSVRKYADLMAHGDEVDVLFLGSSHIMNAVNPAQLYAETGITSYNLGKPGGMLPESYWTLQLALQYCDPKCVVVDVWSLDRDYKFVDVMSGDGTDDTRNAVSLLHTNMDAWPLSGTKFRAVNDLIRDPKTKAEFLFPFSLYHDRWSRLNENDYAKEMKIRDGSSVYLLGGEERTEIYDDPKLYAPEDRSQVLDHETESVRYLKKILDTCRDRNIAVILTFMPMAESYDQDYQAVNYTRNLAEEYGVPFLNLLPQDTQVVIDYATDMSDDTHVNAGGMAKITTFMGQNLVNLPELTDHRTDPACAFYTEKAGEWQNDRINALMEEEDLYRVLQEIRMMGANALIFMRGDSAALHDGTVRNYLAQISGTAVVEEASALNGPYLLLREFDPASGTYRYTEYAGPMQQGDIPCLGGTGEYIGLPDFGAFYLNGDYENNLFDMEEHYGDDVQILILGGGGEVLSTKYFSCDWDG